MESFQLQVIAPLEGYGLCHLRTAVRKPVERGVDEYPQGWVDD